LEEGRRFSLAALVIDQKGGIEDFHAASGLLLATGDRLRESLTVPIVRSTEAGEEIAVLVKQPRDDVVEALVVPLPPVETFFGLL
jgi:hypothetical protein